MRDKDFLWWIADWLVGVHGENPHVDYIGKLVSIAEASGDRETPNMRNYISEDRRIEMRNG